MTDSVKQPNTRTREINLSAEIIKAWGTEYSQPEACYQFASGRQFVSSDRSQSGVYKPSSLNALWGEAHWNNGEALWV